MMLAAAGVLFWMRRASSVTGDLQRAVDRTLTEGTHRGLAVLAFTAVIREGLDRSSSSDRRPPRRTGVPATPGRWPSSQAPWSASPSPLPSASPSTTAVIALDIRTFFRWTGVLLIFISRTLLLRTPSTSSSRSAGSPWGPGRRSTSEPSSTTRELDSSSGTRSWPKMRVVFVTWVVYVVVVLALYLRPVAPPPEPQAEQRPEPARGGVRAPLVVQTPAGLASRRYPSPRVHRLSAGHSSTTWDHQCRTISPPAASRRPPAATAARQLAATSASPPPAPPPKPPWQSPMVLLSVAAVAVASAGPASSHRGASAEGHSLHRRAAARAQFHPTPTELVDPTNPRALGRCTVTVEVGLVGLPMPGLRLLCEIDRARISSTSTSAPAEREPGLPRQGLPRRRRAERGDQSAAGWCSGEPAVLAVPRLPHGEPGRRERGRVRSRDTRPDPPLRWDWIWKPTGPAWKVTPGPRPSWTRLPREQQRACPLRPRSRKSTGCSSGRGHPDGRHHLRSGPADAHRRRARQGLGAPGASARRRLVGLRGVSRAGPSQRQGRRRPRSAWRARRWPRRLPSRGRRSTSPRPARRPAERRDGRGPGRAR